MEDKKCIERQDSLKDHMKNEYYLSETAWDFSDCQDQYEICEAVCKLLIDNFDIAHEGSYIRELIEIACEKCADMGDVYATE